MKTCNKFSETKAISEFHRNRKLKADYLEATYGVTADQYNEMLVLQDSKCAICERPQSEFKRSLAVDHNHITGKIRGLLCDRSNCGLGYFLSDQMTKLLLKSVEYIDKYGK